MESILKYAGLAGLAVSLIFILFNNILKKNLFPRLNQEHGYRLLRLIVWIAFIISLICILVYLFLNNNYLNPISKGTISDSSNQNVVITGSNNVVINGSKNNVNVGQPEYTTNSIDSTFLDFLVSNEGKVVFINTSLITFEHQGLNPDKVDEFGFYKFPYRHVKYKFIYNDHVNYISGYLSSLSLDFLWPGIIHRPIMGECSYYTDRNGYENFTITVNKKDEGCLYYNRGLINIKGTFRAYYEVGGQGYNYLSLTSY